MPTARQPTARPSLGELGATFGGQEQYPPAMIDVLQDDTAAPRRVFLQPFVPTCGRGAANFRTDSRFAASVSGQAAEDDAEPPREQEVILQLVDAVQDGELRM